MTMKILTLSYPHYSKEGPMQYRVEEVVGSTVYVPGGFLCKAEVDDILQYKDKTYRIVMKRNKDPNKES